MPATLIIKTEEQPPNNGQSCVRVEVKTDYQRLTLKAARMTRLITAAIRDVVTAEAKNADQTLIKESDIEVPIWPRKEGA